MPSVWPSTVCLGRPQSTPEKPLKEPQDFDRALHPGGLSVLRGAEVAMGLCEDHLRASDDVYEQRGNASSVTALAVLGRLRGMDVGAGKGRRRSLVASGLDG